MSYLVLVFAISVLFGAFPVSDVLADADIDVPIAEFTDAGDPVFDEPEESEDEKLILSAVSTTAAFRQVSWTCRAVWVSRPVFRSGAYSLPPATAPPGVIL